MARILVEAPLTHEKIAEAFCTIGGDNPWFTVDEDKTDYEAATPIVCLNWAGDPSGKTGLYITGTLSALTFQAYYTNSSNVVTQMGTNFGAINGSNVNTSSGTLDIYIDYVECKYALILGVRLTNASSALPLAFVKPSEEGEDPAILGHPQAEYTPPYFSFNNLSVVNAQGTGTGKQVNWDGATNNEDIQLARPFYDGVVHNNFFIALYNPTMPAYTTYKTTIGNKKYVIWGNHHTGTSNHCALIFEDKEEEAA